MPEEQKHTGRGGKRRGAGRPRTYSKLMAFRARKDVAAYIEKQPNKSQFIQNCIIRTINTESTKKLEEIAVPATNIKPLTLPMVDLKIVAGFPIPLDNSEHTQDTELLQALCPHKESCYMIRVTGNSMIDADIHSGDILVVDRSNRMPTEKQIAICELNGEYTVKRVERDGDHGFLVPANPDYPRIEIKPNDEFSVWGTVTYIIHKAEE